MTEILDHYHGPHHRKLWLLAWAEKIPNGGDTRAGYCPRAIIAHRIDRSPTRASNIAHELEAEGTIKRLGGGVWHKSTVYEMPPLDGSQGSPRTNPTDGPQGSPATNPQGSPATNPQGSPRTNPNPQDPKEPSSLVAAARELREALAGLGAPERDIDAIIAKVKNDPDIERPAAYMRKVARTDQGANLLAGLNRHRPATGHAGGDGPAGRPAPVPWCGTCDERTRLIDLFGGIGRCPACHPLRGIPPGFEGAR